MEATQVDAGEFHDAVRPYTADGGGLCLSNLVLLATGTA
jgi:hypothetical protein